MKMECEIIRDLLPLYADGVCSEESKELVEKHLEECENCREELRLMAQSFEIQKAVPLSEETVAKASASAWRRRKQKSFFAGIMIVLVVFGIGIACFLGSHFFTSADKNNVEALKEKAETYLKTDFTAVEDVVEQGDTIAMRLRTENNKIYLCIFERDSVFKKRFTADGGRLGFEKGEIVSYNFGAGNRILLVFCGSDLPKNAKYYTFQNSGITYTCPVKDGSVLDIFQTQFVYDKFGNLSIGGDINGCPVLLDSKMREIKQ